MIARNVAQFGTGISKIASGDRCMYRTASTTSRSTSSRFPTDSFTGPLVIQMTHPS